LALNGSLGCDRVEAILLVVVTLCSINQIFSQERDEDERQKGNKEGKE